VLFGFRVTPSDIFHNPAALIMNLGHLNSGPGGSYGQGAGNPPSPPPPGGNGNGNGTYDAFPYPENKTKGKGKARGREREEDDDLEDDDLGAYSYPEGAGESDNGAFSRLSFLPWHLDTELTRFGPRRIHRFDDADSQS
jgi:hypothetical protein